MTDRRWNSVYKNLSLLKCNLRIKYEEWRIAWGRQELNRDKRHYPGCTTQSTKCSYCNISVETEHHIYTACPRLEQFWIDARNMVYLEWGILVPLNLKCNRLFGMEKERPDDLLNIFYRSVRYTIFSSRATRHLPSPETLDELLIDELRRKYSGGRVEKYINSNDEQLAIAWFRKKLNTDPAAVTG
jgi:hypothetical protein